MINLIIGIVVGVVIGAVGGYLVLRNNKSIATTINTEVNKITGTNK